MAIFGGKKKLVLGLDIGTSAVKFVDLKDTGKGYEIASMGLMPLPPETILSASVRSIFPLSSFTISATFVLMEPSSSVKDASRISADLDSSGVLRAMTLGLAVAIWGQLLLKVSFA